MPEVRRPWPWSVAELPAYVVVDAGATEHQSAVLASALGLEPGDVDLRSDGALIRIDGERLNHVPMIVGGDPGTAADVNRHPTTATAERVDLDALAALRVPTDEEAIARATAVFDAAMLLPEDAEPAVGHTRFEIYDGDELTLEVELDTRVGFQRRLDGHRLMGPGAANSRPAQPWTPTSAAVDRSTGTHSGTGWSGDRRNIGHR